MSPQKNVCNNTAHSTTRQFIHNIGAVHQEWNWLETPPQVDKVSQMICTLFRNVYKTLLPFLFLFINTMTGVGRHVAFIPYSLLFGPLCTKNEGSRSTTMLTMAQRHGFVGVLKQHTVLSSASPNHHRFPHQTAAGPPTAECQILKSNNMLQAIVMDRR